MDLFLEGLIYGKFAFQNRLSQEPIKFDGLLAKLIFGGRFASQNRSG